MLKGFQKCVSFQLIEKALKQESSLLFDMLWDAPKAHLASMAFLTTKKNIVVISEEGERETHLFDELTFFLKNTPLTFPAWDVIPGDENFPSPDIVGKRFMILEQLVRLSSPQIIVTSLQALLQKVCCPHLLERNILHIKRGDVISFDSLIQKLTSFGYRRTSLAIDKGEFAVRGGILDVFSVSGFDPYRFDFFGDEVEEIRTYDPTSQKSISKQEMVTVYPAHDLPLLNQSEKFYTLLDYLGKETILFFDDLLATEDHYVALKKLPESHSSLFLSFSTFFEKTNFLQTLYCTQHPLESLCEKTDEMKQVFYNKKQSLQPISFEIFDQQIITKRIAHPFIPIKDFFGEQTEKDEYLRSFLQKSIDMSTIFVTTSEAEELSLKEKIEKMNLSSCKERYFERGYLSNGFVLQDSHFVLFPYSELTKRHKTSHQKWRNTHHTPESEFHEIKKGDMVVHFHNGIGKFLGIEKQKNHLGKEEEFFILEYANSSRLYVPLSQSHLISRYIGTKGEMPKLNILGTKKWQQTKAQAQQAIFGYAQDLLNMQAQREVKGGHVYPKDTSDMVLFEEDFPFVETEDQLKAIQEIKADMESSKAMDRLICGDVGYGKTEVAMRAAFKATMIGGKQVAILVPTTVLAMQHYETFTERMANFPINIGIASRFIKPREINTTLKGVAQGSVDILIGTQRIISKDVQFKHLGLIIIDEEHRFGVRAKESLKKMKKGVDCLTLSATPIPRTLYFSLVGIRDISVINTPPQNRLPIKTVLAERDSEIIKNALLREITRGGQTYFIHNRVETIDKIVDEIQALVPQARISVGHGQMSSDMLDKIFHRFKRGSIDILVSTTIMESGVDIPNANTILIDRAHTFGMADLYQLRGRVGRWNRTAYAYFFIPKDRELLELSQKRLQALVETSGFGGGMKLAMRDLEIRGAGDLLGIQQSGNISAIGFHFYCKMLKRTIHTLKQEALLPLFYTRLDFSYDANLPSTYIPEIDLRMELYHRLGETISEEEIDTLTEELIDRFGPLPKQVTWLMALNRIRIFASNHRFITLKFDKIILHAKQQIGNKEIEKKILIPNLKDPEEFVFIVKGLLKRDFKV